MPKYNKFEILAGIVYWPIFAALNQNVKGVASLYYQTIIWEKWQLYCITRRAIRSFLVAFLIRVVWLSWRSLFTSFEPISPVPPITVIFIIKVLWSYFFWCMCKKYCSPVVRLIYFDFQLFFFVYFVKPSYTLCS